MLADMNNENTLDAKKKTKFSGLNAVMLIMFEQDTMIYPKETAWFQCLDPSGVKVIPLEDTDFYKNDNIGLKSLLDAKKVQKISWPGNHLQFTIAQINNVVVPFLKS